MKFKHALMMSTLAVGLALAGGSAFAADMPMAPAAAAAPAPSADGMYVSVFAGAAFATDASGTVTSAPPGITADFPLDTGYIIGGAIGTHLTPNLRGELEASYTSRSVTGTVNFSTGGTVTDSGSFNTLFLLANLWFDFDTGGGFTPYVGGGVGVADLIPSIPSAGADFESSNWAAAAQLGAGIKVNLADNVALDVGYRAKFVFNGEISSPPPALPATVAGINYVDQSIQAALTLGF